MTPGAKWGPPSRNSADRTSPRPLTTRLGNFPISFFAVVMGLCGLVIATQRMEESLEITDVPSTVLLGITLLVLLVLRGVYVMKLLRHWTECVREFNDPVRISFFPAFSIGLLLVSVAFLPIRGPRPSPSGSSAPCSISC